MTITVTSDACGPKHPGPIVPTTPLVKFLVTLQETAFRAFGPKDFDPKLYVDLSLKRNLSATVDAFEKLPRNESGSVLVKELNRFIEEYLAEAKEDLVVVSPVDYVAEPEGFLPKVESPEVRAWALEVHSLWKNLCRKVSGRVLEKPEFHTLLPLENPVIIPGSRFREVYYWDSYWIIRGLLASKMHETAKGMVYNLISLVNEFGYPLNGARAYYTNRRTQKQLLNCQANVLKKSYTGKWLLLQNLEWISALDCKLVDEVVSSLEKSGLICAAGVATSLIESGQQWDFPNGWAPTQHMIAEGLVNSGTERATQVARDIAIKWTKTNYVAFKETRAMHEKYDVRKCGATGGGGEYKPQVSYFIFLNISDRIWLVERCRIGVLGDIWMATDLKLDCT
ncbi:hypothetical protein SASPL_112677 [Salvia splendens]|uniref:alpha,alpha-trehalase n=1 Tax=Salvia splendens TaxID=180675 RepID=A0A8X9A5I9_SALSN|nr:hypothetical protein SASPL_112677 [Salvia splendens]